MILANPRHFWQINRRYAVVALVYFCLFGAPLAVAQISISNGRASVAGQITVPEGVSDVIHDVDTKAFTCTQVRPLKDGEVIASMNSTDQLISVNTVPLRIGTEYVQYPILAWIISKGHDLFLSPATLKFKIDIKAGTVVHTDGPLAFDVKTERSIKAGDSIAVILISFTGGPAILSAETGEGTTIGSTAQPWFTAFPGYVKPDDRSAIIQAFQIEKDYVRLELSR